MSRESGGGVKRPLIALTPENGQEVVPITPNSGGRNYVSLPPLSSLFTTRVGIKAIDWELTCEPRSRRLHLAQALPQSRNVAAAFPRTPP